MKPCELSEILGKSPDCDIFRADHHILSKQNTKKIPEARRLIDAVYPHIFLVEACQKHHEHAHNRDTLIKVLKHRAVTWGEDYIRGALDEVCDSSDKKTLEEYRWDRLISP